MPESALISVVTIPEVVLATSKILADTLRVIVDNPDHIDIQTRPAGKSVTLILSVAPSDIGKVIGRQGRTARSLRTLLRAISTKSGVHFDLDIQSERT